MTFRKLFLSACIPVLVCLASTTVHAAGFGIYGSFGGGNADWSPDFSPTFKKRTEHLGAGLVFDSAPARDKLFNYQLNLGYDQFSNKNANGWGKADFEGFVISNNFGFGGLITPTTRLWFGPELRLEWADGSPSSYSAYNIRMWGLGIGPVLGINFNMGDRTTFFVKAGYQYINYYGTGNGNYSHRTGSSTTPYSRNSYDYDVNEKMFYLSIGYLLRTPGERAPIAQTTP